MPKPPPRIPAAAQSGQPTPTASGPSPTSNVIKRDPLWVEGVDRCCSLSLACISLFRVCVCLSGGPRVSLSSPYSPFTGGERGDWRLLTSRLSVRGWAAATLGLSWQLRSISAQKT